MSPCPKMEVVSLPAGHRPIEMSRQSLNSFDVVSDWVSSMSPHTVSPRCSAILSDGRHAIRNWRQETALPMPSFAKIFRPALSSEGEANQKRPHITNSDQHYQSSDGARQIARIGIYSKEHQLETLERAARAQVKHCAFDYNFNGCAISDADEVTEWEDSIEASETLVERLQFIRRVGLDNTAAGRSLITILLKQSGVCTKQDAAAGAA